MKSAHLKKKKKIVLNILFNSYITTIHNLTCRANDGNRPCHGRWRWRGEHCTCCVVTTLDLCRAAGHARRRGLLWVGCVLLERCATVSKIIIFPDLKEGFH